MLISNINIGILSFLLLFSPLIEGGTTYFPVTIIRILTLILLFIFFYSSIEKGSLKLRKTNFDFLIFLFFLISIISIFFSAYRNISIQWAVNILNYILLFYLTLNIVKEREDEKVILTVLTAIMVFQSLYGISQCLILGFDRAKGTFFNPNFYGSYLGAGILFLRGFPAFGKEEKIYSRLEELFFSKLFLNIISVLCFAAMLLSKSRGAVLSFLAGLVLTAVVLFRANKKIMLIILLVLLLILLLPNPLKTRIENLPGTDIYAFSRINIWKSSISIISDYPFGIGIGMYKYYFPRYNFPIKKALALYGKRADTAHNEYLQIWAELGATGFFVFSLVIYFFYKRSLEIINNVKSPYERGLNIFLLAGICVFLFQACFDAVFHEPAIIILITVFSGILMSKLNLSFKEINFSIRKKPFLLISVALLSILGVIFVCRFFLGYYFSSKGKEFLINKDYKNADEAINKAVLFNPADASYYDLKANILYNKYLQSSNPEFLKEAVNELYFAISLNHQNAPILEHLGFIYSSLSLAEKNKGREMFSKSSLRCYLAAKEFDPFNAYYRNRIGEIYLNLNRLKEAEREFNGLKSIEPNFLPGRVNLLKLYKKTKRNDLAKKETDVILRIYEKNKYFPFSGFYEKNFLKINIDELKPKVAVQSQ